MEEEHKKPYEDFINETEKTATENLKIDMARLQEQWKAYEDVLKTLEADKKAFEADKKAFEEGEEYAKYQAEKKRLQEFASQTQVERTSLTIAQKDYEEKYKLACAEYNKFQGEKEMLRAENSQLLATNSRLSKEMLEITEMTGIQGIRKALEKEACAICAITFSIDEKKNVFITMCGHVFHNECVEKWFIQGKNSCPMCREDVSDHVLKK
jgi:hypothetical protein